MNECQKRKEKKRKIRLFSSPTSLSLSLPNLISSEEEKVGIKSSPTRWFWGRKQCTNCLQLQADNRVGRKEMGGCCCGASRRGQLNGAPVYYYCPRAVEEREPLSSSHNVVSILSTGLLVDTNLDTSSPDTYRAPPAPMPYDADLGRPPTPPGMREDKIDAVGQATDSQSPGNITAGTLLESVAISKDPDCKTQPESDTPLPSPKEAEVEPSKFIEPIISTIEEEDCPICLEEYDADNPKILTKCDHHFHLSCILEWMERSDTCPVCDQEMIFNNTINV